MRRFMFALLTGVFAFSGEGFNADAFDAETVVRKSSHGDRAMRAAMPVHGLSAPPPGYVAMCRREPRLCQSAPSAVRASDDTRRIELTAERWIMLMAVNSYINDLIEPKTDMELYGVEEYWTLPTTAGDCEDYVLLKRQELISRGWPESALLITVVLDEQDEGHAVLSVRTAQGDYILDNKHSRILLWTETPYTYIKRQSYRTPNTWVALTPQGGQPAVATAPGRR